MDNIDFREIDLDFGNVKKLKELRIEQFGQWKRGELPEKAANAYKKWLLEAISKKRVVAKEPGLTRKIYNFAVAGTRHITGGSKPATAETLRERLAICTVCELYDSKRDRCRHSRCGCTVKAKARWASEACPVGRWGRETGET